MSVDKIPKFDDANVPVLNNQMQSLDDNKWDVQQMAANPTDLPQRTLAIVDTGRIYFKQADGTLIYFTKAG